MFKFAKTQQFFSIASALILLTIGHEYPANATQADCDQAQPVDYNSTLRGHSGDAFGSHIFRLDIPSAGLLHLSATTPTVASSAKIEFLDRRCQRAEFNGDSVLFKRTASESLIALESAGYHYLRLRSQDPSLPLGDFRLRVNFAEVRLEEPIFGRKSDEVEVDPDPDALYGNSWHKSDEVEVDPDPDALDGNSWHKSDEVEVDPDPDALYGNSWHKSDEVEVDPDPDALDGNSWHKSDEVEVDPDPDAFDGNDVGPQTFSAAQLSQPGFCHRDSGDDHSDTFICATPLELGRSRDGLIDNDWSDDEDIFELVLARPTTVHIEIATLGAMEPEISLYDLQGQRLAVQFADLAPSSASEMAGASSLTRWLMPGHYFLKLLGKDGSEGSYAIRAESLDW